MFYMQERSLWCNIRHLRWFSKRKSQKMSLLIYSFHKLLEKSSSQPWIVAFISWNLKDCTLFIYIYHYFSFFALTISVPTNLNFYKFPTIYPPSSLSIEPELNEVYIELFTIKTLP